MNNYVKELSHIASTFGQETLVIANEILLNNQFSSWPACQFPDGHHYGNGGLSKHTYEVVRLCLDTADDSDRFGNSPVNIRVLFLAALFHDIGKIWDYKYQPKIVVEDGYEKTIDWVGTIHKRKIHHISKSAIFWSKAVEKTNLFRDIEDDVLHCILSHHGQRQFGSPVAPLSREAWILHLCDNLSARMNDCDRIDLVHIKQT